MLHAETTKPTEKPKVLLIDDEQDLLDLMQLWLSPRYDVRCLSSGETLLDELDIVEPDLVILDVSMPGEDGFKLCRQIRQDRNFAKLPVLFLTSSSLDRDIVKTMGAHLNKPVNRNQLQSKINELLAAPAH